MNDKNSKANRKTMTGNVIGTKMTGVIKVEVLKSYRHKKYHKILNKKNVYFARTSDDSIEVGDEVKIMEARPTAKNVRWVVISNEDKE